MQRWRKSPRRRGFDDGRPGMYFVPMGTAGKVPLFGDIVGGVMMPNNLGKIVRACWDALPAHYAVELDAFVVMPDHIHGLLFVPQDARHPITEIVRGLKSFSAKRINEARDVRAEPVWHRSFHDRFVRDTAELAHIRRYIAQNPSRRPQ